MAWEIVGTYRSEDKNAYGSVNVWVSLNFRLYRYRFRTSAQITSSLINIIDDSLKNSGYTTYHSFSRDNSDIWGFTPADVGLPSDTATASVKWGARWSGSGANSITLYLEREPLNTAPTTPTTISISDTTPDEGQSVTLSWGASSDPEGDGISYIPEIQLNGGTWTVQSSTIGNSMSYTIPSGTTSIAFRVRAYDGQYYSGYITSPTYSVNRKPTIPGAFTSPASGAVLKGGEIVTVSWGASTDADGGTINYELSVSYNNGGSYTIVSTATTLSRSFTIPTNQSNIQIKFRVRAKDSSNAFSGYRESSNYTITHNAIPTLAIKTMDDYPITQNQIIRHREKTHFLFKISVNDSDVNDTLEYSILLRNTEYQLWTNISNGVETEINIPFDSLLLGNNTLQIKVRDNESAETSIIFVVANINPQSYSQQHVYELIAALGYAPTGSGSLQALKYPEYNKSTVSLAELVNFLQ